MKRMYNIEKDLHEDLEVYDCDVKDVFGHKFYVLYDVCINCVSFIAKDCEYNKRRKWYDDRNLQHVIIQKYDKVIDVSKYTYDKIQSLFPTTMMPCKELMNII